MLTRSNPAPEDTAALMMMMASTASYVPKEFSMPSFSLGFTDLSQEETLTQEEQPGSKKGKKEIYCLPPNIGVRTWLLGIMQVGSSYSQNKKKPFMIEDYKMFIPFLELKKLASHPYVSFHF
ncbi:hypothetical protein Ahy_B04g069929 [Arachis hypogaea]|uniref:Uncharacterized protein n=1 Tax=Arachis hypogaea TaxID=3818 RepID=A0A444ZDY2_ARAHY|nr:hypothetical protein Ahy_B04g069929 [Arachis hypogaea]